MDLFEYNSHTYLRAVDYHSQWAKVKILNMLTSEGIITALKRIFLPPIASQKSPFQTMDHGLSYSHSVASLLL